MRKIALHWQILAALILAIIYGIVFPTQYTVNQDAVNDISKKFEDSTIVQVAESLQGETFSSGVAVEEAIKDKLHFDRTFETIQMAALKVSSTNDTSYQLTALDISKLEASQADEKVISLATSMQGAKYDKLELLEGELNVQMEIAKTTHVFKQATYDNRAIYYVSWMGTIFMRALKMLIIPLILSSIVSGVTNIGSGDSLGRLGIKTIGYYIFTSTIAILTGLFFVNIIKPGVGANLSAASEVEGLAESAGGLSQTLIQIIPTNIFESMAKGDMLSIIFFAVLLGFFITRIGNKAKTLLSDFFNAFFDVMMKITMFIIKFTPLGIFGLVAKTIADVDDLSTLASRMGIYMLTVLLALAFHAAISLPLVLRFLGKVNPLKQFRAVTTPLLTAFSTSSSGATLPLTMNAVEKKAGVSNKISSFTLPLGATINMDGTALYELVAAMFIAQAYGLDMTMMEQIIMVVTALLASIGAAAIPMAGLVMITVILTAVGLPLEGVGLILAVDRILDMFRTSINVWSDTCGASLIASSEGEELDVRVK